MTKLEIAAVTMVIVISSCWIGFLYFKINSLVKKMFNLELRVWDVEHEFESHKGCRIEKDELDYIYRKANILPYRFKNQLDDYFESEDYEIFPPKENGV